MPRKGFTKLIDIHDQADRLNKTLERFLQAHGFEFQKAHHNGFYRWNVAEADYSSASAVVPALRQMADGGPDVP
jgi:hypothetical protein